MHEYLTSLLGRLGRIEMVHEWPCLVLQDHPVIANRFVVIWR